MVPMPVAQLQLMVPMPVVQFEVPWPNIKETERGYVQSRNDVEIPAM